MELWHKKEDKWDDFRNKYPARPFCLLVPEEDGYGILTPPDNFLSDSLTTVEFNITRDKNDTTKISDWVDKCGLDMYNTAKVRWVALFIDDSGSMNEWQVEASRDNFYEQMAKQGIEVKKVVNGDENWILPFLTTLAPEEEANSVVSID